MFKVHIQSKLLPVMVQGTGLLWFLCPGQEKKKGGGGEGVRGNCLYWRLQGSTSSATGGWFEVLWNLECLVTLI